MYNLRAALLLTTVYLALTANLQLSNILTGLTNAQGKSVEQITALNRLLEEEQVLVRMQEVISQNLQYMATSEQFQNTLRGLDESLSNLKPTLQGLSRGLTVTLGGPAAS